MAPSSLTPYTMLMDASHELPEAPSDEELAGRVQAGDAEAFGELVDRYESKLKRYGRKFLSDPADLDDLVQDIFIRAYRNIQGFNTSMRFSPWIYRIAHNLFVNALRSRSRAPFIVIDFDTLLSHPVAAEETDTEATRGEMKRIVDHGLSLIPTHYREILLLYYEEELSYKEIGDVLKVPVGTVGVRLARAKAALRAAYQKNDITYEF